MHPDGQAVFSSDVPGCQANMANWLCYSETLIFTQLTKSLWRWRVLHALCWAHQTSRLTRRQMHSFWTQSAFFLFFFSWVENTALYYCPLQESAWSLSETSEHTFDNPVILVLNSMLLSNECFLKHCLARVKDGQGVESRVSFTCLGEIKLNGI